MAELGRIEDDFVLIGLSHTPTRGSWYELSGNGAVVSSRHAANPCATIHQANHAGVFTGSSHTLHIVVMCDNPISTDDLSPIADVNVVSYLIRPVQYINERLKHNHRLPRPHIHPS